MRLVHLSLLLALCVPAFAQEETVPLPKPRPVEVQSEPEIPLPRQRPEPAAPAVSPEPEPAGSVAPEGPKTEPGKVDVEPAAPKVPPRIYQSACPAVISGVVSGGMLPPIREGQCGIRSPLAVTAVHANGRNVPLSSEITTSCGMASALPDWVAEVDRYLEARENTRLAEVLVGTSYMCRNVNNASGGNLSFHAFAEAVDVTGFVLEDGRRMSLPEGWTDPLSPEGRLLRFAHGAACARFTTTLGPEANALHHDHLHLDMGCHGKSCTARICE